MKEQQQESNKGKKRRDKREKEEGMAYREGRMRKIASQDISEKRSGR